MQAPGRVVAGAVIALVLVVVFIVRITVSVVMTTIALVANATIATDPFTVAGTAHSTTMDCLCL